MPAVDDARAVTSLRIWHCSYKTLAPIRAFENLEALDIAGFPDASLDVLLPLTKVATLHVVHVPKVTDLTPVASFRRLASLSLATLPGWDSSGKKTVVASLEPIAGIESLRHLSLFGIVPPDSSLAPLERCRQLRSAHFQGYPKAEIARFFTTTGIPNAHDPTHVDG